MKKNIVIVVIGVVIVALLLFIVYQNYDRREVLDNNENIPSNDNVSNNESIQSYELDNNVTNNDDIKILWEMRVSNKNGAKVYYYPHGKDGKVLTTFPHNTEVDVIGELYDYGDDYKYYIMVYFNSLETDDYFYGYIKREDLEYIDNSISSLSYDNEKKYMAVTNIKSIYNGPGLMFRDKEKKINIPSGEVLDVKYYNYIYSIIGPNSNEGINNALWLYIEYNGVKGWVKAGSDHTVNYPYQGHDDYTGLVELVSKNGEISTGDSKINLYINPFKNDVLSVIPEKTKLEYDKFVSLGVGAIGAYRVTYNNKIGWIKAFDSDSCDRKSNEYLIGIMDECTNDDCTYKMCFNQQLN